MNGRYLRGLMLALAAAAISGLSVFVNGYGVRAVPDATVYTTAKNLVATFVLGVLAVTAALSRRPRLPDRASEPSADPPGIPHHQTTAGLRRGQIAGLVAVAVIGGSVPFVLFFEGLARASSTHAAFVQKTLVAWVAVLAIVLLRERLRVVHIVAIAAIIGGLIALDGGLVGFRFGSGEALILAATLLWAVEVIIAKRLLRDLPPLTVARYRMGGGVLVLLGWLAVSGRLGALTDLGVTGWRWSLLTGLLLACYVAVWFNALSRAGAIDVTAVLSVGAVITALLSASVHGTVLPQRSIAGVALLCCGALAIVSYAARRRVRS